MQNQKESLKFLLLKEFNIRCKENKIFYSLFSKTLENSLNSPNYLNEKEELEVLMTLESYLLLKEKFPLNCLDNTNHSKFFLLNPRFVLNKNTFKYGDDYIKIIIILPTLKSRAFLATDLLKYIRLKIGSLRTNRNFGKKLKFWENLILFLLPKKFFKFTTYDICDKLSLNKDEETEGFFKINESHFSFKNSWQVNFNSVTKEVIFLNSSFTILKIFDSKNFKY
ncbi:hypothetical protein [[Mycoplasma] mobile]|uniref:Expressed protein n=1 Tax=Mycoplasma mobile (strain ATCC 43663 / 163K / NCTC 11711) TaxID=267748 RepID=Q6KIQ0_MYCM1|nr:hypothetical protein [[Mycoplasma] mobile]AAT27526.1 expressed protein [Mycoplasma mobile 163K]